MPPLMKPDSEIVAPIRCMISDVDGVMTNGLITYNSTGAESKSFHVRDGLAIKLWMRSGFEFGIITARESSVVSMRAKELGIKCVVQGCSNKLAAATELLDRWGYGWQDACYVGDDLPDLPVLQSVGLSVAPSDGAKDVTDSADWIVKAAGGEGVLRECVERILRAKGRWEQHVPQAIR